MKQYNVMEFAGIVDRITANGKGICEKDGQPKKGRKLIKGNSNKSLKESRLSKKPCAQFTKNRTKKAVKPNLKSLTLIEIG